ncbi:MAG: hypothetical protein V1775_08385 [Bacteroidota bacterium]
MKEKIVSVIVIAFLFASCTSVKKINTAKAKDILGAGVIHMPVVADLDVKETKVLGQASVKGCKNSLKSMEMAKMLALSDALNNSQADVLIEPRFETEIKGRKITVKVAGFPGNYKNFRPVEPEDLPLLESEACQRLNLFLPEDIHKKAKLKKAGKTRFMPR